MRIVSIVAIGLMSALFAPHIEAKQPTEQVARGFDDCHHAVYGRAIKFAPGNIQKIAPGTVEMDRVTISRNIRFDKSTNEFVIKHTGVYRINYFIKAFISSIVALKNGLFDGETFDVAVQVNDGRLRAYQRLQPLVTPEDYNSFVGHRSLLLPLRKKDRVKLVVVGIPTSGSRPIYSDIGSSQDRPDIAAYLMVSKAERND